MKGYGARKTIGRALQAVSALGTPGLMDMKNTKKEKASMALGALMLAGLGEGLVQWEKHSGGGLKEEVQKLAHLAHQHRGALHIDDLGFSLAQRRKMLKHLQKLHLNVAKRFQGNGLELSGGRINAIEKLKAFIAGKTKVKPSHILGYLSGGLGVAAAVAPAGVATAPLAVPLGIASGVAGGLSTILGTAGRGYCPNNCPKGSGLKLSGQGLKLSGQGLELSGGRRRKRGYSRYEVWEAGAGGGIMTGGGLKYEDLMKKGNRIISRKKHMMGKTLYQKNKMKMHKF